VVVRSAFILDDNEWESAHKMAYRMKEVAERAGVSITTVSHVINNTRFVAPQTRERILNIIKELGFYADAHARRLKSGRSDSFGLIVSDIRNPFFPEIITSFETAAIQKGFELYLCNTNYDPARSEGAVRRMIENKVRGVAIMTSEIPSHVAETLAVHHIPTVFLDVGEVAPYTSNIRVDYSAGIYEAIDHLFRLGHHEFVFIAGPQNLRSAVVRREAFWDGLCSHGIQNCQIIEGNHRVDGGISAVQSLLSGSKLATAILCSNDLTAIGALSTLQKAGLHIPRDVSVVGFDNIDLASLAYPPLTTVSLPRDGLGKLAFEALQNILESERHEGTEYVIKTQLKIRESTAGICLDDESKDGELDTREPTGIVPEVLAS